jgi:hypothetical protein
MSSETDRYDEIYDSFRTKVAAIFTELVGDRASRLQGLSSRDVQKPFDDALSTDRPGSLSKDIAFHLTDWKEDAAFLVAVYLFPERFTPEEIATGVGSLLIHAPNHMAAAATLAGYPIQDVFEIGVPQHPEDEDEAQETEK